MSVLNAISDAGDFIVDAGTALGEGIYSVGEDVVYGIERTAEGLGVRGLKRATEIGYENDAMVDLLDALFQHSITAVKNPLTRIVFAILVKYYDQIPEETLQTLAKQAGIKGSYLTGRMVIGKKLAAKIATKIARKIALSAAYKKLAKKIGVSAGVGSTGIGVPISMVMLQGVLQRASDASKRLKGIAPDLHRELRGTDRLDLLYFLVEKSMHKHMNAIAGARLVKQAQEWMR